MPVPDAYKKIQAYDQIRRRPGEVIGDCIVREQRAFREMTEALRRVRNSRTEKSGVRFWPNRLWPKFRFLVVCKDFGFLGVNCLGFLKLIV